MERRILKIKVCEYVKDQNFKILHIIQIVQNVLPDLTYVFFKID